MFNRRHFEKSSSLEDRLAAESRRLRDAAKRTDSIIERERLIRKARQAETASHISEWLRSAELQPPK